MVSSKVLERHCKALFIKQVFPRLLKPTTPSLEEGGGGKEGGGGREERGERSEDGGGFLILEGEGEREEEEGPAIEVGAEGMGWEEGRGGGGERERGGVGGDREGGRREGEGIEEEEEEEEEGECAHMRLCLMRHSLEQRFGSLQRQGRSVDEKRRQIAHCLREGRPG